MNIQLNIDISRFRTGYPWESNKIVQSSNINYDIQIVQINIYSSMFNLCFNTNKTDRRPIKLIR